MQIESNKSIVVSVSARLEDAAAATSTDTVSSALSEKLDDCLRRIFACGRGLLITLLIQALGEKENKPQRSWVSYFKQFLVVLPTWA